jgi:hypothetical protein
MLLIGIFIASWFALMVAFVVLWAAHHARIRAEQGIDEELYVNGLDEYSLREAA